MSAVLTTGSNVTCGHRGPGKDGRVSTSSSAKLTVAGNRVLLKSSIEGKTVANCATPPSTNSAPCLTVDAVSRGEATKLRAGGSPVMLDTLGGETSGTVGGTTPQLLLAATAGQSKLTAT